MVICLHWEVYLTLANAITTPRLWLGVMHINTRNHNR